MDSSFQPQNYQHHFQGTKKSHTNNNLTRFRSAPSSFFTSLFDSERPLSPETEDIFTTFMSDIADDQTNELCDIPENSFVVQVKTETEFVTSSKPVVYQSQSKPPLANQKNSFRTGFPAMGMKITNNNNNNNNNNIKNYGLTRHSSSPAGFFANILNILDNGFEEVKGIGKFAGQTQAPSSSGLISQKSIDSIFSDDDHEEDDLDQKSISELDASEIQRRQVMNRRPRLVHHLSLPKKLKEISDMEKLLFEDTVVPCRIRAKRGCATHPRSIAERVRRTKISERMRKLQDLVPNMDNQINTADMLDLAVEYIKDLQNQITMMKDYRAKCTCLRYTYS